MTTTEKKLRVAMRALRIIAMKNAMFANEIAMKEEATKALAAIDGIEYLEGI